MKKNYTIRALLGITQEDLAMLLGVSRGQWSMYEIGKRDLPLPAQQLLADMLVYVNSPDTAAKNPLLASRNAAKQAQLDVMLRENYFQQLKIAKKITVLLKKQENRSRLAHLADFVAARNAQKGTTASGAVLLMTAKASQRVEQADTATLVKLEMKQELLVLEKLLAEAQLLKVAVL